MSRTRRLAIVLGLNLGLVAALVAVGIIARSLAVFAEGGDYLLDAAGVAVTIFAARLAARTQDSDQPTARLSANSIAALINAGWLLALEVLVTAGAADRLLTRVPHVAGLPVLIVSTIAALVMTAGAFILRGDSGDEDDDEDLSVAAVLLDTIADAAAAAGVAAAGAIIFVAHGFFWMDPLVALVIAAVISWQAIALIRKVLARRIPRQTPQPDS